MHTPRKKSTSKKNPKRVRHPGIVEDARTLGVNRSTLYRMLRGEGAWGKLKTLRQRYDELQRQKRRQSGR